MAKVKYRRTISFNAATYVRLRNYCRRQGLAMAGLLDDVVNELLDKKREPAVFQADAVAEVKAELAVEEPT